MKSAKKRILFVIIGLVIGVPIFIGIMYLLDANFDAMTLSGCLLGAIVAGFISELIFSRRKVQQNAKTE